LQKRKDFSPQYKVFKEYFVMCWAGQKKEVKDKIFYSRVDIELINEQVRLFFSTLDEVSISYNENVFNIIEYVNLGLQGTNKYYKLEETLIKFNDNASYTIETQLLFEPPQFDKKILHHIYNANNALLKDIQIGATLNKQQEFDLRNLPVTYLICYFNGFEEAITKLEGSKPYLKKYSNDVYKLYKEAIRVLRKIKYN